MKSNQEMPSPSNIPLATSEVDQSDVYRSLIVASRRAKAKSVFYREAIRMIAQYFNSPYAAVSVQQSTSVIEDAWHTGPTDPEFWKNSVQNFLTECLADNRARVQQFTSKQANIKVAMAACPLVDGSGGSIGAIALVVTCNDQQESQFCLAEIQGLANLMSACANHIGESQSHGPSQSGLATDHFDTISRAAAYTSKHEIAIAVTNKLRNKIGCDQVALGKVQHRRVKILSISGFDDVSPRNPGVANIRSAMEECLDRGKPIVFQKDDWNGPQVATDHRLHKQWSIAAAGAAVATIPLTVDGTATCILSLRRQADKPFSREEIDKIRGLVEPLVPGVTLVERAGRPLVTHVADTVTESVVAMIQPHKPLRKVVLVVAVLFGGWFLLGSAEHKITVSCVVVPDRVQHVLAPFDGIIKAAHATAGDKVTDGQILYELDTADLELERDRLLANTAVAKIEIDRAVVAKSMVDAKLAHTQVRLFNAQLEIIQRKVKQAAARARFSGTIVQGDLRKQIGQVVKQGTPIFEVAPDDGWLLELEIPDVLVGDVEVGLIAKFYPQARPEHSQACRIVRIRPTAESRHGENVFIAEARLEKGLDWLRPGMEGATRIQIGRRSVRWVVMHRAINYLRLKLWL